MTEPELVQAYQEGQVSRRTFIRRLAASGVSLASAIVYADALWGSPVQAGNFDDFYRGPSAGAGAEILVSHFAFTPSFVAVSQGAVVVWRFPQGQDPHHDVDGPGTFMDTQDQNSVGVGGDDLWRRPFPSAGTFRYRCPETNHPLMEGVVEVPMQRDRGKGKTGTGFLITWSSQADLDDAYGPYVFDVQLKKPRRKRDGATRARKKPKWKTWQNGTRAASAVYRPKREGRHRFRARLRRLSDGQASDWSPKISIRAT